MDKIFICIGWFIDRVVFFPWLVVWALVSFPFIWGSGVWFNPFKRRFQWFSRRLRNANICGRMDPPNTQVIDQTLIAPVVGLYMVVGLITWLAIIYPRQTLWGALAIIVVGGLGCLGHHSLKVYYEWRKRSECDKQIHRK